MLVKLRGRLNYLDSGGGTPGSPTQAVNSIIMSGIASKQKAFKFIIAPHKQNSIVEKNIWQEDAPSPLANGALCLSTPKHNGKSGTDGTYYMWSFVT